MNESISNNSEFKRELNEACSALASTNSTEGIERFLDKYGEEMSRNEIQDVRSRVVSRILNKTDHQLAGGALKAHANKCKTVTERINQLLDKQSDPFLEDVMHLEAIRAKEERGVQKNKIKPAITSTRMNRPVGKVKSYKTTVDPKNIERIKGELETHTYKGVEVLVIKGQSKKGKDIVQVIAMQGGKLDGVSIGNTYAEDFLPQQLKFAMYPELEFSYLDQKRAQAEAEKAAKREVSNKNKKKDNKDETKKKKGGMSKEEKKKAKRAA